MRNNLFFFLKASKEINIFQGSYVKHYTQNINHFNDHYERHKYVLEFQIGRAATFKLSFGKLTIINFPDFVTRTPLVQKEKGGTSRRQLEKRLTFRMQPRMIPDGGRWPPRRYLDLRQAGIVSRERFPGKLVDAIGTVTWEIFRPEFYELENATRPRGSCAFTAGIPHGCARISTRRPRTMHGVRR